MIPVAGGLGPPQGMYKINIFKFFTLVRYIKQNSSALMLRSMIMN